MALGNEQNIEMREGTLSSVHYKHMCDTDPTKRSKLAETESRNLCSKYITLHLSVRFNKSSLSSLGNHTYYVKF